MGAWLSYNAWGRGEADASLPRPAGDSPAGERQSCAPGLKLHTPKQTDCRSTQAPVTTALRGRKCGNLLSAVSARLRHPMHIVAHLYVRRTARQRKTRPRDIHQRRPFLPFSRSLSLPIHSSALSTLILVRLRLTPCSKPPSLVPETVFWPRLADLGKKTASST